LAPVGFSNQSQINHPQSAHNAHPAIVGHRPHMIRTGPMMASGRPRPAIMMNQAQLIAPDFADEFGIPESPSFSQSPVLMMYGLHPEKMTCDRVFNILCLYGNVIKVFTHLTLFMFSRCKCSLFKCLSGSAARVTVFYSIDI